MKQIVLQIVCYFAVLASVAFRAECACKTMCTMQYAPVCGSDGRTYSNKCVLEAAACESKTDITVAHNGECETAADPGPSCNTMCTMQYAPVCGSDGRTYSNKCVLEAEACQTKKDITVAHDGECETAADPGPSCNTMCTTLYAPVCGSDGKTYSNKCVLEAEACQTKKDITVAHDGECETAAAYSCDQVSCPDGKSCVLNDESRPECVCNEFCNRIYRPVCGSDGKTYSNKCELEATACRNDEIITVSHNGQC